MTFLEEKVDSFLENFDRNKEKIRAFEGCQHLELLQQTDQPNVYFTYSYWNSEQDLNSYRNSPLFKEVWAFTKTLFSDKPAAWSLTQKAKL